MKAKEGSMHLVLQLLLVYIVMFAIYAILFLRMQKTTSNDIEDSLTSSLLAAATIEIGTYGNQNMIAISEKSYQKFLYYFTKNVKLNSNMVPLNQVTLENEPFQVESYIVYNIQGSNIEEIKRTAIGVIQVSYYENDGSHKTPNNITIENSTIYCRISYKNKGFHEAGEGTRIKEKCVDIKKNE